MKQPHTLEPAPSQAPTPDPASQPLPSQDAVLTAIAVLEQLQSARHLLSRLPFEQRRALLAAAGRLSNPSDKEHKKARKDKRRLNREEKREADQQVIDATGLRRQRKVPVPHVRWVTPPPALDITQQEGALLPIGQLPEALLEEAARVAVVPEAPDLTREASAEQHEGAASATDGSRARATSTTGLHAARTCYICKEDYTGVHFFYDSMCQTCGDFNYARRTQTADLSGRTALVTGARVKIGYFAGLMLLRAGARVIVTTRFPRDAAARYAAEPDFSSFADRLVIHGLDLRHAPSVELFTHHLLETEPRLDFILNNACQTVRRPPGFYAHMLADETAPLETVPAAQRALLASHEQLKQRLLGTPIGPVIDQAPTLLPMASASPTRHSVGVVESARLSQQPFLDEDFQPVEQVFPSGHLDADLQQVDLRAVNSWRLTMAEVATPEVLEVHLVNAIAPFILNARLKPLMLRHPSRDKHIVNVSAMEGQFYRAIKTDRHPHTNMAKAALNMMTRTSAPDYARDGIFMNAVDTGWITDEDPAIHAVRKAEQGFQPPLDAIDGAARICDPIFSGFLTGQHVFGLFLKDYKPTRW